MSTSVAVPYPVAAHEPHPPRRASQPPAVVAQHSRSSSTAVSGASQSRPGYVATSSPVAPPEQYYGHEETARMGSRYISVTFGCPENPQLASTGSSPPTPTPPLPLFIAYALHRTRLHPCVTFTALYLLSRLKNRFPAARGSSGHRLFISAFMIASKVVCDDTYSNKSWCVVGQGMFTLREINQMEREMCGYLEWQLNFDPADLKEFEMHVRKEYGPGGPAQRSIYFASPSSSTSSSSPAAASTAAVTAPAPLALASTRPVVPPINTTLASRKFALASPPQSPTLDTPTSSTSADSSPESMTCLTPPSDDGRDTVVHAEAVATLPGSRHAHYSSMSNLTSSVAAASIVPSVVAKPIPEHQHQPFQQPFVSSTVW